jgi:hypothetical protein
MGDQIRVKLVKKKPFSTHLVPIYWYLLFIDPFLQGQTINLPEGSYSTIVSGLDAMGCLGFFLMPGDTEHRGETYTGTSSRSWSQSDASDFGMMIMSPINRG